MFGLFVTIFFLLLIGAAYGFTFCVPLMFVHYLLMRFQLKELGGERGVIMTFGRFTGIKDPGSTVFVIPFIQRMYCVSTYPHPVEVPPQEAITRDKTNVSVSATIYIQRFAAQSAAQPTTPDSAAPCTDEDFKAMAGQAAQTALRELINHQDFDELLTQRDTMKKKLQGILSRMVEPWGAQIIGVEIGNIDLPQVMRLPSQEK